MVNIASKVIQFPFKAAWGATKFIGNVTLGLIGLLGLKVLSSRVEKNLLKNEPPHIAVKMLGNNVFLLFNH